PYTDVAVDTGEITLVQRHEPSRIRACGRHQLAVRIPGPSGHDRLRNQCPQCHDLLSIVATFPSSWVVRLTERRVFCYRVIEDGMLLLPKWSRFGQQGWTYPDSNQRDPPPQPTWRGRQTKPPGGHLPPRKPQE